MAEPKGPIQMNVHNYKKDSLTGNLTIDEIPTQSIKKAVQLLTLDTNVALAVGTAGWTPNGTAPLRLTYLALAASTERIDFALADRNGTFDVIAVGTQGGIDPKTVRLQGAPEAPIHIVQGTMNIYNASGSVATGTFNIAYEGVRTIGPQ